MINTKQTGPARVEISMSNDSVEVFPVEEDLVNDSQQVRPAQIIIPGQLLLEEMSRSEKNGNNITVKINALLHFYFIYCVPRNWWLCISLDNKTTITTILLFEKLITLKISLQRFSYLYFVPSGFILQNNNCILWKLTYLKLGCFCRNHPNCTHSLSKLERLSA